MTKQKFIKHLKELKSIIEDSEKVNQAMKKLSPDFGGFWNDRAETLIVDILRDIFNDESDWIGYYIYELEWGKKYKDGYITENGKNIKLKTMNDLYNILKNNGINKKTKKGNKTTRKK